MLFLDSHYGENRISLHRFGPFLKPECAVSSLDPKTIFTPNVTADSTNFSSNQLCEALKTTVQKLMEFSKIHTRGWFDFDIGKWTFKQMQELCKGNIAAIVSQEVVAIYKLCIPLLLSSTSNADKLSELIQISHDNADGKNDSLAQSIEEVSQEYLYERRNDVLPGNPWTYRSNVSTRDIFESALTEKPGSIDPHLRSEISCYIKNPLKDRALWKILFHDERTYTLFMRCTNSLGHFENELSHFLNTMGKLRGDPESFLDLVRYHYDVVKTKLIPSLNSLTINSETKKKLQVAWGMIQQMEREPIVIPAWIKADSKRLALLSNLYRPEARRLYPDADIEKLCAVSDKKVDELSNTLNNPNITTDQYKDILRDSECTRYALKAYLTEKIKFESFVSLCMAWSVTNVYDPECKHVTIVRCCDPTVRPYFHGNYERDKTKLDPIIDAAIHLTTRTLQTSEQFVLFLDFDETSSNHSDLIKFIHSFEYFFFPCAQHWVVPSITLFENMLSTLFGPQYAKPLIGLGDFVTEDFSKALLTGDRPLQISMSGIGNSCYADGQLTVSHSMLANGKKKLNDPTMWLHDFFHLYVVGAIPLSHRLFFRTLAEFIKTTDTIANENTRNKAYERTLDMQFLEYGQSDAHQAFIKSINSIAKYLPSDVVTVFLSSHHNEIVAICPDFTWKSTT